MTDWMVRRWVRFGHERLYAETPGGTALGYFDVKTGRYHSDDVSNLPLLQKAISDHLGTPYPVVVPVVAMVDDRHSTGGAPLTATDDVSFVPPVSAATRAGLEESRQAWTDLSGTAPGAAARERALAERAAQGSVRHVLARLLGVKTDERAWRIGADGELAVGAQLARLGPQWRALHAVRVGENGSDIDHVVIGPGGVFTVNAKNHPHKSIWVGGDTLLINGRSAPYVRTSRHEAGRAARLLTEHAGFPVAVTGVIAVMGAHDGFKVKKQPEDGAVVVVQRRRISQYLGGLPVRLREREIDAIFEVARRSTTWQ